MKGITYGESIDMLLGTVVMACRDLEKCEGAIRDIQETYDGRLVCMELDLSSFKSIDRFVRAFNERFWRLDGLVNNAAVATVNSVTWDGLGLVMGVNHYGPVRLTVGLLPKLLESQVGFCFFFWSWVGENCVCFEWVTYEWTYSF